MNSTHTLTRLPSTRSAPSIFWSMLFLFILWYIHKNWMAAVPETVTGCFNLDALRLKIFESGPIPFLIVCTFLYGVLYLWQIQLRFAPLALGSLPDRPLTEAVQSGKFHNAMVRIKLPEFINTMQDEKIPDELKLLISANKIALGHYGQRLDLLWSRWTEDRDLVAVQALKNEILEIDDEDVTLSFVAVNWCEVALPLLGFLGTVVGIGQAIGNIGVAVQKAMGGSTEVASIGEFGAGFRDMALAFDTTFLGLFFVLVLGILHVGMKKCLALRLSHARELYSKAMMQLQAEGASPIVVELERVYKKIADVEAMLRKQDKRSSAYRERVETLVEHVVMEDPRFESIKNALLKPIVEFKEVGRQFTSQIKATLNNVGKNWAIQALGLPSSQSKGGLAFLHIEAKKEGTKNALLIFGKDEGLSNRVVWTKETFDSVFPSRNLDIALGEVKRKSKMRLVVVELGSSSGGAVKIRELPIELTGDLRPLCFEYSKADWVLVSQQIGGEVELMLLEISQTPNPRRLTRLSPGYTWDKWSIDKQNGTVFVSGRSREREESGWRLVVIGMREQRDPSTKKQPKETRLETENLGTVDLPKDLKPQELLPLGHGGLAILDQSGSLYYWDKKRATPLLLQNPEWPKDPSTIRAGHSGWIAVVAGRQLSMWQIRRGGFLHKYPGDALSTGDVLTEYMSVTPDGSYLVGMSNKRLYKWEFPRTVADSL